MCHATSQPDNALNRIIQYPSTQLSILNLIVARLYSANPAPTQRLTQHKRYLDFDTRLAKAPARYGLITQTCDDNNRHRQFIAITKAGQKIIVDNTDQAAEFVAGFKRLLGNKDYEQLLDLLSRLDPEAEE